MTIGQVAKEAGLAASAIRFYEQAGVLPRPIRVGGRRHYDSSVLERLAVLERAKACGFTLAEARELLFGFRGDTPHFPAVADAGAAQNQRTGRTSPQDRSYKSTAGTPLLVQGSRRMWAADPGEKTNRNGRTVSQIGRA